MGLARILLAASLAGALAWSGGWAAWSGGWAAWSGGWAAWSGGWAAGGSERPLVAVSIPPLAYLVERLAGERVRVEIMLPPGASEASYEPRLAQMKVLASAALYVKVGHPRFAFETSWIEPLLADRPELAVFDCTAAILPTPGVQDDPHVWLSPRRMRAMAGALARALALVLPTAAPEIEAALAALRAEIDALDAELRGRLAAVQGARFFVVHPAWGYLASDYGLVQVAIEREGKEPDAGALAAVIAQARASGARVVFSDPALSLASAELLAREIGGQARPLDPLARDWARNLRAVASALAEGAVP